MKKLSILIVLLVLASCGGKAPMVKSAAMADKNLKIFTYGDTKQDFANSLRNLHGSQLSAKLHGNKLFASVEYAGDGKDIAGFDTTLRVSFIYSTRGADGWPLELKAHYILEEQGKTVFNQVYTVAATKINAAQLCPDCSASQTALQLLEKQVLPDLIEKIERL